MGRDFFELRQKKIRKGGGGSTSPLLLIYLPEFHLMNRRQFHKLTCIMIDHNVFNWFNHQRANKKTFGKKEVKWKYHSTHQVFSFVGNNAEGGQHLAHDVGWSLSRTSGAVLRASNPSKKQKFASFISWKWGKPFFRGTWNFLNEWINGKWRKSGGKIERFQNS